MAWTIACIHTAASNVGVYDAAAAGLGLDGAASIEFDLHHVVLPRLLEDVDIDGTAAEIDDLASRFDAVLVTCSTVGEAVDRVSAMGAKPIDRADRALIVSIVQSSMAPAADRCARPVFTVPGAALSAMLEQLA